MTTSKKKEELLQIVETTLNEVMPRISERPAVLHEAIRYAVGTGGKRIRPLICLAAAEAVGGKASDARYPAAAIELLHNYTLIHDDLPAMDNDTLRRGKPTVWKKFGEANAVLAGDALLTLACSVMAKVPQRRFRVLGVFCEKGLGVVRGQAEDILPGEKDLDYIYTHKTADLFVAAAQTGGLAGGGRIGAVRALGTFAYNLGLAFQYKDDLLDGDSPLARAETEARARKATTAAVAALEKLPGDVRFLKALAAELLGRKA